MALPFNEPAGGSGSDFMVGGTTNFGQLQKQFGGGGMPSAGGAPTTGAPTQDIPFVYVGEVSPSFPADDITALKTHDATFSAPTSSKAIPLDKALDKFDRWTFEKQRNMLRLLAIAGFLGPIPLDEVEAAIQDASQMDAREAYGALLETASDYWEKRIAVTPNEVLRSAIAYRLQGMGIDWDGKFGTFEKGVPKDYLKAYANATGQDFADILGLEDENKPFKTVSTETQIDILNPKDAKALTRAMLQQELGRDPTQAEYEDFMAALMAAERNDPTTARTVSKYGVDARGEHFLQDQTTTVHQGIGAEGLPQMAYEKAQRNPDWAEWQAVGTYFPALLQALGSTVPGS